MTIDDGDGDVDDDDDDDDDDGNGDGDCDGDDVEGQTTTERKTRGGTRWWWRGDFLLLFGSPNGSLDRRLRLPHHRRDSVKIPKRPPPPFS